MPGGRDPRRPVHVQPDVLAPAQPALAGMHAHPDAHRAVGRPRMLSEVPLCFGAGGDGIDRRCEHGEERVAFGPDVRAADLTYRRAKDRMVLLKHRRPPIAQRAGQVGRALDVREQERHRPGGKLRHATSSRRIVAKWTGPRMGAAASFRARPSGARPAP